MKRLHSISKFSKSYLSPLFINNNYKYFCSGRSAKVNEVHKYSSLAKLNSNMGLPLNEVIKKLEAFAPLKIAESWDNVGLLVEPAGDVNVSSMLVTIDLTEDVVQEAIQVGAQLIVSYHPNIFKPLKTVTQK